ncbi:MAG: chloride channel protein, partial [Clostridia bacterium]
MQKIVNFIKEKCQPIVAFCKWVVIGIAVGAVVGLVGCAFYLALGFVGETREKYTWLIWLMPLAGLLIVFLYRASGVSKSGGTNIVLLAVRSEEDIPFKMAPLIFVATILTHLVGGSAGREGAALQLGGSIAHQMGKIIKLDRKDLHIITMCGMSACFAAVFGTPIAAAVFALEVVSVGVMYYAAIVPCAIAALVSMLVGGLFGVIHPAMPIAAIPVISPETLALTLALGVLCALVSLAFCKMLTGASRLAERYVKNQYARVLAGSALILVLTMLVGTRDYMGAGVGIIARAIEGNARPEAFILKMVFTSITLAAAFKGGEIVPTMFIGATFGAAVGAFLGLPPSFCAGVAMIAVFCGVTNCPITSMLIGIELFGTEIAPYLLIACAASYMLSGYSGLYSKQKIMYSKLRPEFVNKHI